MTASFTEGMARDILEAERSTTRFENYCCALFSEVDGRTYVTTSWNYDQARDGRATDLGTKQSSAEICATLRVDVLDKAEEDADSRAKKGPPPQILRFCSNQRITEKVADAVKAIFLKHMPNIAHVDITGTYQFPSLAVGHRTSFEQHYLGELANLRAALGVNETDAAEIQLTGMRIALTTQLGADAHLLREDLQVNLILTALADGKSRTVSALCKDVSSFLHLSRVIQEEYLQSSLEQMTLGGVVSLSRGVYSITAKGRRAVATRTEKGSEVLIAGQGLIKALLMQLTGAEVDPKDFATMWQTVQDEIAAMFLRNGIYITESVASILKGQSQISDHHDLRDAVHSLGQKVTALDLWGNRSHEIGLAVVDMFYDRSSEAFKWLTGLCAVYVSLCSLGLERSAESEIEARLREIDLLLDTDIVLSLLSPGEPLHTAITAVVNGWKRITGHVYVTPAVLEETAYHAWISTRDYEQSWHELGTMTDIDAQRLLSNAFTRGFRIEAKGKFHPARWSQYIGMFCGSSPYDYAKIVEILKDEHVFPVSEENIDGVVAEEVAKAILAHWQADAPVGDGPDNKEARHKAEGDGSVIASLLKHRQAREKVGGTAVLVSSSGRLRMACDSIREKLGEPEPVIPVGAIAYYLTMLPGVSLSFGTLREVLFDIGYAAQLSGLDRMALRILHASKEYVLPFSRRGSLRHAMRAEINKLAKQQGRRPRELEHDMVHGNMEMIDDITSVVAASVDNVTRSKSEKRVERMERELRTHRKGNY